MEDKQAKKQNMRETLNVMLVDDERIVRNDLKTILDWEGYQYHIAAEAENGIEALRILEQYEIQILIVDIEMPKMNGLELAEQVMALSKIVKIIFLTAHKNFDFIRTCMHLGIDSYILKHEIDKKILLTELERMRKALYTSVRTNLFYKNEILLELLSELRTEEEYVRILRENKITFRERDTYFLSVRIENEDNQKDVKKQSIDLISCSLNNHFIDEYNIFSSEDGALTILLILKNNMNKESRGLMLLSCADKIRAMMETILKSPFFILISEAIMSVKQIYFVYQKMQKQKDLRWFYQTSRIIFCETQKQEEERFDEEVYHICQYISERDYEKAKELVQKLFLEKMVGKKDRNYCNEILVQVTDAVAKAWNREHRGTPPISSAELYKKSGEFPNIFAVEKWLSGFLQDMQMIEAEKGKGRINKVKDYVEQHYMEDISLEQLGKVIDVTEAYMSQFFKQQTGTTFKAYLKNLRMEKAKEMLLYSNEKVHNVGKKLGYSTTAYFCLVFKQHFGITPSEFIRRNSKNEKK